jgi:zinc/manganese transport system substrate-binding protein
MSLRRTWAGLVLAVAAASTLVACSSSGGSSGGAGLRVVASTDVYGDIVKQIAGSDVSITSIISDPDQDPHSYEANARTQLALSRADLVVENGGGYDDFVDRMLSSSGKHPTTVNVVTLSGKTAPKGGDLNEHVWYDFPTVVKLADTLVTDLSSEDPSQASTFRSRGATFVAAVRGLEQKEVAIKAADAGVGVAITEPVPLYMLQACGLVDRTPAAFSHAIEEGDDVSVGVLKQTLDLFSQKQVKALVYNEQTSGPETTKVLDAAHQAGIAVVPVTETLPSGDSYLQWMTANLTAVAKAVGTTS